MDYYQTITAHLLGESQLIKTIRADEASALPRAVVTKLRQTQPTNSNLKTIAPEDILAVVNIKTCRLLKLTGKVWDQLSSGDEIWLVSPKEWKEHSDKVLVHECKIRHGKKLMIRNPAALNPKQLFDMVELYFPNIEKKFTELVSPAATPPPKMKSPVAIKEKAPFLKAHKGSPNKNGALSYSERRKNRVSSPTHADTAVETEIMKRDGSPSPVGKRKYNGSPANLTPSNREQTVLPPMSPTLLRRVGLGRNLELSPIHHSVPFGEQELPEEAEADPRLGSNNSPHLFVDLEAAAAEERKDGNHPVIDNGAVAADGSDSSRSHHSNSHSVAASQDRSASSAGPYSDVNVIGDDATVGTLTTYTNSVANSGIASSIHDVSTTPGNTMYGYESRRGLNNSSNHTGGAPVVEFDLQGLLGTPALEIDIDNLNDTDLNALDVDVAAAGALLGQDDFYYEVDSVDDDNDGNSSSGEGPPRSPLSSNSSHSPQDYTEPVFERLPQESSQAVSPSHVHSFTFGPTSENVMVLESLDDADENRPVTESAQVQPPRAERRRVRLEFHPQHDEFAHGHLRGTRSEESPSPYLGSTSSHREWGEMEDIMSVGDVSALSELSVNSGLVGHPLMHYNTRPAAALLGELEEELESQQDSEDTNGPVDLGVDTRNDLHLRSSRDPSDSPSAGSKVVVGVTDRTDDDCIDASIVPVVDSLEEQSIITDMPLSRPGSPRAYTNDVSVISSPTGASSLQEVSLSGGSGAEMDLDGTDSASVRLVVPSHDDRSILTDLPLTPSLSVSRSRDCLDTHSEVTVASLPTEVASVLEEEEDCTDLSIVPVAGAVDDQSIMTEMPVSVSPVPLPVEESAASTENGVEENPGLPADDSRFLTSLDSTAEQSAAASEGVEGLCDDACVDASGSTVSPPVAVQSVQSDLGAVASPEVISEVVEDSDASVLLESEVIAEATIDSLLVEADKEEIDKIEEVVDGTQESNALLLLVAADGDGPCQEEGEEVPNVTMSQELEEMIPEAEEDLCADASVLPVPDSDLQRDDFSIATELLSVMSEPPATPVVRAVPAAEAPVPIPDAVDDAAPIESLLLTADSVVDSLLAVQATEEGEETLSEVADALTSVIAQVQVQDSLQDETDQSPQVPNLMTALSTLSEQSLVGEVVTGEDSTEVGAQVQQEPVETMQKQIADTEGKEVETDCNSTQSIGATFSELSLSTKSLKDRDEGEEQGESVSGAVLEGTTLAEGIALAGLADTSEDLPVVRPEEQPLPGLQQVMQEVAQEVHESDPMENFEKDAGEAPQEAQEEAPVEDKSDLRKEIACIVEALTDEIVSSDGFVTAESQIPPNLREAASSKVPPSIVEIETSTASTEIVPSGSSEGVEVDPISVDTVLSGDAEAEADEEFLRDDLTFSADLVFSADNNTPPSAHSHTVATLMLPLGLSDSLESVESAEERDVPPEGEKNDGDSDTESALDALFDSLAGELSHLSEEFHHSMDHSTPLPSEVHSVHVAPPVREGWVTPPKVVDTAVVAAVGGESNARHSPLMASSSMLITLSPDRELEYSSRFIKNSATSMSSRASSSDHDSQVSSSSQSSQSASRSEAEDIVPSDTGMSELSPSPAEKMNRTSDLESVQQAQAEQLSVAESLNFSTEVPVDAPSDHATPPAILSTEVAHELQVKVQRQAEELAEANRVKAALEARLDETRQLLQIFAAGRAMPLGTAHSPTGRSKISAAQMALLSPQPSYGDIDLDALENTLMSDSVQSIAAEGLHHLSDYGGGPASSSKMRKSLRRLLDRKREEKSRGSPRSLAGKKTLRASDHHHSGNEAEEDSPIAPHYPKQKMKNHPEGGESSDSGISSDARSNPSLPRSAYSSPRTSRKAPASSASSALKSDRAAGSGFMDSPQQKMFIAKSASGSIGIADNNPLSVDELEMEVKYVQGLVLHGSTESTLLDSPHSPQRPVLDLTDIYSSQSSDDRDKRAERDQKRLFANSSPPPPPPPSLPLQQLQGETSAEPPVPSENESSAAPPRSPPKRPQNLSISVSEEVAYPKNQHILSPRHLNVEVSSSSDDELSEVSMRSFVQPKAPPATGVALLKPQPAGGSSHTSPKAATDPKAMNIMNPADPDSAQGSEGDYSSEESQNPLLLMSTPKIRGLGRPRPLQPPAAMPLALGAAGSVQFSEEPEVLEDDRLHSHFFQDHHDGSTDQNRKASSPPRRTVATSSLLPAGESQTRSNDTFLYNYDSYHAMRPDLFLDSGPNSPFNPHSPFQHPTDCEARRQNQALTIMGRIEEQRFASDLSARLGNEDPCSLVLSETQANTAANASIASNLTTMLRANRDTTPSSVEKVKFSDSPLTSIAVFEPGMFVVKEEPRLVTPPPHSILKDESRLKTPPLVSSLKEEPPVTKSPPLTNPAEVVEEKLEIETQNSNVLAEQSSQSISSDPAPPTGTMTPPKVLESVSVSVSVPVSAPQQPHTPPPPVRQQPVATSTPVSAAKAVPTLPSPESHTDKLAALFAYSLPMLVTARYLENSSLRGMTGRQEIARTTGLRDLLAWCVFQAYGTPDGAIVKGIK